MYPTLIRVGSFEVTTFGLMMFLAFISAGWLLARQFRKHGIDEELASSMVLAAALGGIIGAKVYYAILFRDWRLLFDRAGLVWYGGLIGGALACAWVVWRRGVDILRAADATAPSLALGYAIGRIGCFLVGDDYGRPTDAWYGVAFPRGAPPTSAYELRRFGVNVDPSIPDSTILRVHPTQLYETAMSMIIFFVLMAMERRGYARGKASAVFLILLGLERFLVEFVRAKDDRFFGPFTVAQVISVILIVFGTAIFIRSGGGASGRSGAPAVQLRRS